MEGRQESPDYTPPPHRPQPDPESDGGHVCRVLPLRHPTAVLVPPSAGLRAGAGAPAPRHPANVPITTNPRPPVKQSRNIIPISRNRDLIDNGNRYSVPLIRSENRAWDTSRN